MNSLTSSKLQPIGNGSSIVLPRSVKTEGRRSPRASPPLYCTRVRCGQPRVQAAESQTTFYSFFGARLIQVSRCVIDLSTEWLQPSTSVPPNLPAGTERSLKVVFYVGTESVSMSTIHSKKSNYLGQSFSNNLTIRFNFR